MIIVTGGAGFIGSNLVKLLSENSKTSICIVDWFTDQNKKNYSKRKSILKILPNKLNLFLKKKKKEISLIIHLGAITATTETNANLIIENNINLSYFLWDWCSQNNKRFIYASSAATYGIGDNGFDDNESDEYLSKLQPLNLYGWSKHVIDRLFIKNYKKRPLQWVGLKFFNVYGPNEYHKGDMKSIVVKIFDKIMNNKQVHLFKSHKNTVLDGQQIRDFIYVKDVIKVINWFIENKNHNGIYNIGSGIERSFNDLASAVFKFSNKEKNISYIDTPLNIRDRYQYYTKANMNKIRKVGFSEKFFTLEEGIEDYIVNHLNKKDRYI